MAEIIVSVISAVALKQAQISALETLMSKKLNAPVELSLTVDPSIIGGLSIRAGGYLLDRTVRTQLRDMKVSVMNDVGDNGAVSDIERDVGGNR